MGIEKALADYQFNYFAPKTGQNMVKYENITLMEIGGIIYMTRELLADTHSQNINIKQKVLVFLIHSKRAAALNCLALNLNKIAT
jgi:hypothetical protein